MKRVLLYALALGGVAVAQAREPAPVEIRLWHALNAVQAHELDELTARFNASQAHWRVVAAANGGTREPPHIQQADETRTAELLGKKHTVRPLWQVMNQAKKPLDVKYVTAVAAALSDKRGRLLALPLNASTPIVYFNRDAFRRAKLDPVVPRSWYDMAGTLGALVEAGEKCGLTTAWPSWVLLENMTAWHDEPFATRHNGVDGDDARLSFNGQLMVRWIAMLASWEKSGYFTYAGRENEAEARFAAGECAILTSSSGSYASLAERARFDLGVAPLPYYDDFSAAPQNTLVRGSALWVMDGRPKREYAGVAAFLAFLAAPEAQAQWQQMTGSAPLSEAAYYKRHPGQEIALQQLMVKSPKKSSRAMRLAAMPGIRQIIHEELESVWGGKKTPLDALNAAVLRGNGLLQTHGTSGVTQAR